MDSNQSKQTVLAPDGADEDKCLDMLLLPSCIESFSSSASQLRQLAVDTHHIYIKNLFTYYVSTNLSRASINRSKSSAQKPGQGPTSNPRHQHSPPVESQAIPTDLTQFTNDQAILKRLDTVISILPFLKDISAHYEKSFATIDSTLRRMTYYLNKQTATKPVSDLMASDEFNLPRSTRIDSILIAWMDLIYALVSLDDLIRTYCNIFTDLSLFQAACKTTMQASSTTDINLASIPRKQLADLQQFIATIQLTICDSNQTLFQECIARLRNLTLTLSSSVGFQQLCNLMGSFITFYCANMIDLATSSSTSIASQDLINQSINLKLIPSLYLDSQSKRLFGICSIYILHSWMTTEVDSSVTKSFMGAIQKFRLSSRTIQLISSIGCLNLPVFIKCHLNHRSSNAKPHSQLENIDTSCKLEHIDTELSQQHDRFAALLMTWTVQFKNFILTRGRSELDVKTDSTCSLLLAEILTLTADISSLVKDTVINHSFHDESISRSSIVLLLRMVSMLKQVEQTIDEHRVVIYKFLSKMQSTVRISCTKVIETSRKHFLLLKYSHRTINMPTFIVLTDICHRFGTLTASSHGRTILALCLSMLAPSFGDHQLAELSRLLFQLNLSLDFFPKLANYSDCQLIYWLLPTISTYYNHFFEDDFSNLHDSKWIHLAFEDIHNLFESCSPQRVASNNFFEDKKVSLLTQIEADLTDQFKSEVMDRLCQELEIELRLQTHRAIQIECLNPFKRHLYNFKNLFSPSNKNLVFRIFNQRISLPHYVEHYLNQVSYNLTALAPQDWPVYEEMANLADRKFNLNLKGNSQLPMQAVECDFNLSDIFSNLALFVSRYSYDQLDQTFIEKYVPRNSLVSTQSFSSISDAMTAASVIQQPSSLNVIKPDQVSRWISSHGFGVVNNSANSIYQTMRLLVSMLTKQVQDEKLVSLVVREKQRLDQQQASHSAAQNISVTFEQASQLARKHRFKTVQSSDDSSSLQRHESRTVDLDTLRHMVTQIGNLWGLLRLLTNGAIDCAAKSVQYFPEQPNVMQDDSFANLIRHEINDIDSDLELAATTLDDCISDVTGNYSPKANIGEMIYDVFKKFFGPNEMQVAGDLNDSSQQSQGEQQLDAKHKQFQLFHLIIPALVVTYIDYLVYCKDRASSRAASVRYCTLMTDDGFAMGLAFVLNVTDQMKDFARLCWFEHVLQTLDEDRREIETKLKDPEVEESLKQTSNMTLRRLTRLHEEYAAAHYTISGALVFFQGLNAGRS